MSKKSEPAMPEAVIQQKIVRTLRDAGFFCHSVPNEGAGSNAIRTGQMISTGLYPGTADLVVWLGHGRVLYMEVKNSCGRQSDSQKRFQEICKEHDYQYVIVRSAKAALLAANTAKALSSSESEKGDA